MVCCRPSSEPVIFLYHCVYFTYYSIIPQLILQKLCLRSKDVNSAVCQHGANDTMSDELHQEASTVWFYVLLCDQLTSIFTIFLSGTMTDIMGRQKLLVAIPLIDMAASAVFFINSYFITSHPASIIPGFLLIALFGEMQGVATICYTIVADIDENTNHRTTRLALVEAAMCAAGIVGTMTAGQILQTLGFQAVFLMTFSIDFILFLYVFFYFRKMYERQVSDKEPTLMMEDKEEETAELLSSDVSSQQMALINGSEDSDNDEKNEGKRINAVETVAKYSSSIYCQHVKKLFNFLMTNVKFSFLFITFTLLYFAFQGELLIQTLFLKHKPFFFSSRYIGYYGGVQAGARALGAILISQLSFHVPHMNDYHLVVVGCLSQMISFIVIGSSSSTLGVFGGTALSFASPLSFCGIRSLLSKEVLRNSVGSILSLLGSLAMVAALICNLVSVWTYKSTVVTYSGIVYFMLAGFSGMAAIVMIATYLKFEKKKE